MISNDIKIMIPSPPPPPCTKFRYNILAKLVETKKSKQTRRDYEIYMNGYSDGIKTYKQLLQHQKQKG